MSGAFRTGPGRARRSRQAHPLHLRRQELRRLRRRHARLGADRQRRASYRPLVQVSPAARHPVARLGRRQRGSSRSTPARAASRPICARRRSSSTRASARSARTPGPRSNGTRSPSTACSRRSCPPASTTRPSCSRRAAWMSVYEPIIRHAAGMGRAPTDPDPDHYAFEYAHCDVAVVGAGPAGLAAALAASRAGARVSLFDEQAEFGGSLLAETRASIDGATASDWLAATLAELAASPRVTMLPRTQIFGYYAQNFLAGQQRLTDHLGSIPTRRCRASGCGRCARAKWCWRPARTSARWCSPTTIVRGSCSPRPRARWRRATASSRGCGSSSRPRTTRPIAPRWISPKPAARSR